MICLQHIWALEGEREARGQEATEAAQRHALALEQVKLRDMAAADLQKKVHTSLLPKRQSPVHVMEHHSTHCLPGSCMAAADLQKELHKCRGG